MGLDIKIKGLSREETYHGGYGIFSSYRILLAYSYSQEIGELYKKHVYGDIGERNKPTQEEVERYDKICNDDLDILLFHSDCDGKLTPKECRKIYMAIKDLKCDCPDMHELWLNMLKHCYTKRVNMYFY